VPSHRVLAPGESYSFQLFNFGFCGPVTFTLQSSAEWLLVQASSLTIPDGGDVMITVGVSEALLPPGAHEAHATMLGPNAVVFTVTSSK
jgi:hypothetical protein